MQSTELHPNVDSFEKSRPVESFALIISLTLSPGIILSLSSSSLQYLPF